jgi:hypothetical protein
MKPFPTRKPIGAASLSINRYFIPEAIIEKSRKPDIECTDLKNYPILE